jgi:anti-sigma factor RsiW
MSAALPGELTCREMVELVTDFLEGRLQLADRTRFELHICYCGGCRAYLQQMRALVAAAGKLTEESVSAEAKAALLQAFRRWKQREEA